jgi:aspartyl/asparaginyl-tRNA synthetase
MGQVGDLFGGVNALFAGLALAGLVISIEASRRANAREREWEKDKEFVNQVRATYEWAFLALSDGSRASQAVAKRDRLGWLSAARHLSRAAKLEAQIKSEAMHAILGEHKEYWRLEIHRLLDRTNLDIDFMASTKGAHVEPYIEYRSALVIAQFLESGWDDPIDAVDAHALINRFDFEHGRLNRAIESYIVQTLPGFLDEHLKRFPKGRVAKLREQVEKAAADRKDAYE